MKSTLEAGAMRLPTGRFLGRTVRQSFVNGLVLTESAYSPAERLPRHIHQSAFFSFVIEGSYTERVGRSSRERPVFSVAFHPGGEEHADNFHRATSRTLGVELTGPWSERLQQAISLRVPRTWAGGPARSIAMRLYREFRAGKDASSLVIEGLALELAGEAGRSFAQRLGSRPPRWLATVEELLRAEFRKTLSLSTLAELSGVHPVHVAKTFRRWHRCTCGEFVRRLRIEHAQRRLLESCASLAEIAVEAGYYDQSHFARCFRRETGIAPGEFRARHGAASRVLQG